MHRVIYALVSDKSRQEIVSIRNGLSEYISDKKCTEEEFVQCICKILNDDGSSRQIKADLLRVLREQGVFIVNIRSFDEIIQTLNSLFQLGTKNPSENFIRSQVLTTITCILLTCEHLIERDSFDSWFVSHFRRMWKLLQDSNDGNTLILREIVCECFIEIEETFPVTNENILLEDLVAIGFKENFYPFQNYANLISLSIKNIAKFNSISMSRTNEILLLLSESQLRDDVSSVFEGFNVNKVLIQLMDLTPLFSTFSSYYVTANIMEIVDALQLNPSIFKTFVHRNSQAYDLVIIRMILDLRKTFGNRLFAKNEGDSLIEQTVAKSSHPHYVSARQCLLLDWTLQYLLTLDVTCSAEFCWPLPWDSPDVEERKLCILTLILSHKSEVGQRAFIGYLDSLIFRLEYDYDGHQITTLCRLLFHCYCTYNYFEFDKQVMRIVLNVISDHPRFIKHISELLIKIKHLKEPKSCLFASVMSLAVNHITDLPEDVTSENLAHYLTFLVKCAEEEAAMAQPRKILRFIARLLDGRALEDDMSKSWYVGHCVLEVCKRLLCRHNSNLYFSDLGEILQQIFTSHSDLDVRDRAEFYYMLLTSLSPKKITAMLNFKPQNQNGNYNFTHLVSGDTTYSYPSPVAVVSEEILRLNRVPEDVVNVEDTADLSMDVDLEFYFKWLHDNLIQWRMDFKYELSIAPNVGREYDDLYAIVLSFYGTTLSDEIQYVDVLHLSKDKGSAIVAVDFFPGSSVPSIVSACAVFNTKDGQTCSVELAPLSVEFEHLFKPLPVPSDFLECSRQYRDQLADRLWEKFTDNTKGYHRSVIRILIDREKYENAMIPALMKYVTRNMNSEDTKMECTFGIFLPQRSHLILRSNYTEENAERSATVFLATDNRDLLPLINIFLRSFEI